MGGSQSRRRSKSGRSHCRGPLDGSLYAKVNKNKKSENEDSNYVTEETRKSSCNHEQESTPNSNQAERTARSPKTPNSPNPNVVVLNGNKIIYKPQADFDFTPGNVTAPLANLSEFKDSYLSISTCGGSAPSLSSVTKISVTSSSELEKPSTNLNTSPPRYQEIMAEGSIQQTAAVIVDDVINRSTKGNVNTENSKQRFSELSSCSATTLSSTTTEDGGPRMELSDNDTSDSCSIHDVHIESIEGNLSPITIKGNLSPEIVLESTRSVGNEKVFPFEATFDPQSTAPTVPAPAVPRGPVRLTSAHGVMQNGFLVQDSNKSSEYAVPMRDMKITTIPSKRAVLVSTGSENDNMASPSSDRRDSVYDEGNTFNGSGYATIEEYVGEQSIPDKSPDTEEHSYIPEDVQELLNGLTEGPTISDIDSGFHGSSMALQSSSQKSPFDNNINIASQSSSEISDSLGSPVPALSKDTSPTYDGNYSNGNGMSPERNSPEIMNPQVMAKVSFFDSKARSDSKDHAASFQDQASSFQDHPSSFQTRKSETEVQTDNSSNVTNVPSAALKKNTNPGIPIPTQTLPEPQPAQVQIITMRNVYTNDQGIPLNQSQQPTTLNSPNIERTKISNTLRTQPSATEYQQKPSQTVEKPPLPPQVANAPETAVTMRHHSVPVESVPMTTDNLNDPFEDNLEDELDSENIRSMEEQIKHTQRHLEFLREQQEKLVKRKQDRTKYRETLKRNSTNFDRHSQGFSISGVPTATLPGQPYNVTQEPESVSPTIVQPPSSGPPIKEPENEMPPITNVNQGGLGRPNQHVAPQNSWNSGPRPNHQVPDMSHTRNGPTESAVPPKNEKPVLRRHQEKDDIIMSSDLQDQLAELDKCIAELTTSMDIPAPQDAPEEPQGVRQRKSYTLEIERKMDPTIIPQEEKSVSPAAIPSPPRRSRSSFDSYKRLSQDFDITTQRRSYTEQVSGGSDDVFSPGPDISRLKKKQSPFPPQTSVTRRQHAAPQPPPNRRLSLEERLSPILVQTLAANPGGKPKEDIHSYKEDLDPDIPPETPTFPLSPATPYVNTDAPARVKSPAGLVKTPLSMLHLKPTDKPMENLSPSPEPLESKKEVEAPKEVTPPQETVVDGPVAQVLVQRPTVVPEPQIQATVALQNGLAKETDLLADDTEPAKPVVQQIVQQPVNGQVQFERPQQSVFQNNMKPIQQQSQVPHPSQAPPSHLDLPVNNNLHPNQQKPLQQIQMNQMQEQQQQRSITPQQQYIHHNSSGSHSSHSPAATSSNSRRGSSDSLDGPSTRHSNSSILSSSSSSSATHNTMHGMHPGHVMRPGSQLSNYERHYLTSTASGTRSGDESFGSPQSGRTSSSSISDVERMNYDVSHATVSTAPKFIRDTTAYWYKPNITREDALAILRSKPAGSFVVRDSRCFPGAFGLALKVDKLPPNIQLKPGADIVNEYVRHFLIEPSSRGVKLKGCPNEPVFGSLSALVYQHSITPLALPCKLIIPTTDQEVPKPPPSPQARQPEPAPAQTTAAELLKQGAACNVIYLGSVDTESLTGPPAIERAIRETYQLAKSNPNTTSIVHFKVTPQGITLTDNARKLFFRRHYPTETVTYCGLDPMGGANKGSNARRWDATGMRGGPDAWIFGFVARKQAGSRDNTCHVFAELDTNQPARAIVNFVMKVLIGFSRQNSSS